jgi:two-component system heavy metal sensor histidine kinase CusS
MTSLGRTLRRRLLAALFLALAICGAGISLSVRQHLTAQYDAGLSSKARFLGSLVKEEAGEGVEVDVDDAPMPEFNRGPTAEYYQVWFEANGALNVLARSPSLGGRDLPSPESVADVTLPDGRRGRAVTLRIPVRFQPKRGLPGYTPRGPRHARVVVARQRTSLDEAENGVFWALGLAGLVLMLGVPLAVGQAVTHSLRPLGRLGDEVANIDARSLGQRFSTADVPAELAPIVARLNALLERLAASFERERRFSADVAHELRTPLAELRATAEVALRFPEGNPHPPGVMEDVLGATTQLERLVEALFTLARCESGGQVLALERVNLGQALEDAWSPFAERAAAKRLKITGPSATGVEVTADPVLLGSVLANLFANALEYTPVEGEITSSVAPRESGGIELVLSNTNGDLGSGDLTRAFEPFWRKDAARSGGVHSGLGLSLVAAFARLMGATITLERPGPDRVQARLVLRAAGSTANMTAA